MREKTSAIGAMGDSRGAMTIILLIAIIALALLLPAFLLMLAWDAVMPALFGLPEIQYWQAWLLLFVCGLLFRSSKCN